MKTNKIKSIINKIPLQVALSLENNIRRTINEGERSGIHYPLNPHRSSSAGEPPKTQTGNLISKNHLFTIQDGNSYKVVMTAPYARDLEFGTRKIAPRPFVQQSIDETIKELK